MKSLHEVNADGRIIYPTVKRADDAGSSPRNTVPEGARVLACLKEARYA